MPRREDIDSILIIGSGPIVIGQACEFDYSGTQACRAISEEGYRVVLANSNPATIMTDPDFADATYIEPLDANFLTKIIEREIKDHPGKKMALLPTLGGQTGLNIAMELQRRGTLAKHNIELIGADAKAIATAEDRELFKVAMTEIGLEVARSGIAHNMEEARQVAKEVGLPAIIRPAYILGGRGTGIAHTAEEFESIASYGLECSPISEILIEESIAGWKEFELEVMRDHKDNCVVVCAIENFDPMGVHTGDSITVAPTQTLSDVEYQRMRNGSFACIRRVGVETGGSNVQWAVHPETGRQVIIEMNPRVSRSSALASKATGFPIAKIAAKLAIGYSLDEIPNDITKKTPASFEPTIDYVVTKIPRWAFEKFPGTSGVLGTSMQSVGEVMAIGRTFCESLQKALRSLEQGRHGLNCDPAEEALQHIGDDELLAKIETPTPERIFQIEALLRRGVSIEAIYEASKVDPWFLDQMLMICQERAELSSQSLATISPAGLKRAKQLGFADAQLGYLWNATEQEVRLRRKELGIGATFKTVDTCAAEFEATTPYHYSTYEDTCEVRPGKDSKVVILGSGPNRIGQGIEFDYCCVHASFALRDAGYETVMVNCNPETVSTDYDTSDRLYFEPITAEDVANIIEVEKPVGVIVSLGGQTPLKLASQIPVELIAGTSPQAIDAAEDRKQWNALCAKLEIPQPAGGTALNLSQALEITERIGYPALIRPSYVLGGRAMEIVYSDEELRQGFRQLTQANALGREGGLAADRPILIDRFLEDATEVDVDAIRDGQGEVFIGAVMEHVEEAGVHSGDSACYIPPIDLSAQTVQVLEGHTKRIAKALGVVGLINVQYAVKDNQVFALEANPRASRTVPFVAKATGVPLAKIASRIMLGATLEGLRGEGLLGSPKGSGYVAVKEAVLPFNRFPEADALLGPEMRSTGEVMGIDINPGLAFLKSQFAAGARLPAISDENVNVFMSLADRDKPLAAEVGKGFRDFGFRILATEGTAAALEREGVEVSLVVPKLSNQNGPHAAHAHPVELIENGTISIVVNSPRGRGSRADGAHIRSAAALANVPLLTTAAAALALVDGLREWKRFPLGVQSLQEYHRGKSQGRLHGGLFSQVL